jgi:putative inorganic carbon (hco3(-)) transporter
VLGLWLAVLLSHLSHLYFTGVIDSGFDFFKVVVYYFLFVGLVNCRERIRQFLLALVLFSLVLTVLAVCQYHGLITLPNLTTLKEIFKDQASGREAFLPRLRGSGIFQDPKEICLVLIPGVLLGLYWMGERRFGGLRFLWAVPVGLFGYALFLTQSRGGLVSLAVGLLVFFRLRFGWMKTILLSAVLLPGMLVLFAGRMTNISAGEGSGDSRVQVWSDSLMFFRQSPVFGVGHERYLEQARLVAHNAYLHGFAELGFFGGVLFLGAFYLALGPLLRLGADGRQILDPELRRLHPYLTAVIAGYAAGMFFLSFGYIAPTYMILGLATTYLQAVPLSPPLEGRRFDSRLVGRLVLVAAGFLVTMYALIRVLGQLT